MVARRGSRRGGVAGGSRILSLARGQPGRVSHQKPMSAGFWLSLSYHPPRPTPVFGDAVFGERRWTLCRPTLKSEWTLHVDSSAQSPVSTGCTPLPPPPRLTEEMGLQGWPWEASVQFSRSVVSDSLRPHGLQHTRSPCPSPTPGVYPNSCPLSR